MHEYSIVGALIESCEENARENGSAKITKVVVKIGVMSGVEPELLERAFETFKENSICDGAEFIMNIQPVVIVCNLCQKKSTLTKNEYFCPHCQSVEIEVVDGEEIYLMQLELQ